MSNRFISKQDAEAIQSATKILNRLQQEGNSRLNALRKAGKSGSSRDYVNAKSRYAYFVETCKNHGCSATCHGDIIILPTIKGV